MKERGILFSGPLVRSLLAGTKTQTRRLVKRDGAPILLKHPSHYLQPMHGVSPPPDPVEFGDRGLWREVGPDYPDDETDDVRCPYGAPGDRLWVRETFDAPPGSELIAEVAYRADYERDPEGATWRPSIFMPRWASRITLEVTSVRVERLQDISEEDAKAEGVLSVNLGPLLRDEDMIPGAARMLFRNLWDTINGERASWASNPFVWAISFRRLP